MARTTGSARRIAAQPATPKQAGARLGPLDRLLDPEIFKALADATRVRLLACLAKCARPCGVSEIAECCDVDLSVVSRHLQMLQRAGLTDSIKQGREVRYSVRHVEVCSMLRTLADAIEACKPDGASCCGDAGACGQGGCCERS